MNNKARLAAAGTSLVVLATGAVGLIYAFDDSLGHKKTERFTVSQPVHKLVVVSASGDVSVVAADTDRITVQRTAHGQVDDPSPTKKISGQILRLSDQCGGDWRVFRCETEYRIVVPRNLAVEIDTSAGDVTAKGLAGPLLVTSSAGDVTATRLSAQLVEATTNAGDVQLAFGTVPSLVNAKSNAGDINIEVPHAEYALSADSDSGETFVSGIVRGDLAHHSLEAQSAAGDVRIHGR